MHTYSIVFRPPAFGIEYVKGLKDMLDSRIGWFKSRNAEAHITVLEFKIDESRLHIAIAFLNRFCQRLVPFTVHFDAFGTYPQGTFFLAPDQASKDLLVPLMKELGASFPLSAMKVTDPHMSIARELNNATLNEAQVFFATTKPELSFQIDAVYLRKLKKSDYPQFEIADSFPFGNQPNHAAVWPVQGTLL